MAKNNTYKDITLNYTQSKKRWDKQIQQYRDADNRSVNTIEN